MELNTILKMSHTQGLITDFVDLCISTQGEENLRLSSQQKFEYIEEIIDINEEKPPKKVKKRIRIRKRKKKTKNEPFSFKFGEPDSKSTFYRKRDNIDANCQHVNEFFYENGPHIFKSNHHQQKEQINMSNKSSDESLEAPNGKNDPILTTESTKSNNKNENLQSMKTKNLKKNNKTSKMNKSNVSDDEDGMKKKKSTNFLEYFDKNDVEEGLKSGVLIKGAIRINQKNYHKAYISNSDKSCRDYVLETKMDRNRALEGDVVVIRVKPEEEWDDEQPSAEVVYIYEKIHSRIAIGTLTSTWNRGKKIILLQPRDPRLPRVLIQNSNITFNAKDFFKNPTPFENNLYKTKIIDWVKPLFAIGGKLEFVGDKNDVKSETKAILTEFDLDVTPFPVELQREIELKIESVQKDLFECCDEMREDLTKDCVFSIDPETARDLDDALSFKVLKNGNYEVGVHIADVSFYLSEGGDLDKIISRKATTIYLVDKVYHMLPEIMCKNLSLLPGKNSFTFSVFWEFSKDDLSILSHRFSRSIINNCCQLSYEHAQKMIDDESIKNFPKIYNNFKQKDLKKIIKKLQEIAVILRKDRFDSGALRIDQVKIGFHLDPESGVPLSFFRCENTESNRLIEEFMLLANITVAKRILNDFPDLAFLRCHEPPNPRLIGEVKNMLESVGIILDVSSSGGIHRSLQEYSSDSFLGMSRNAVLNHLLAKPMTRARYLCAGVEENFEHYALSTPIYTHFTSPIRRYADVMVHRLLSASLGYTSKPNWTMDHVIETAANCNKQKYNAKRAGEAQSDLFLLHYIENHQPFITEAVVVEVREKFFDVLVLNTGSIARIYVKEVDVPCHAEKIGTNGEKPFWRLKLDFGDSERKVIEIFEIVEVALSRKQKSNCLHATMVVRKRLENN